MIPLINIRFFCFNKLLYAIVCNAFVKFCEGIWCPLQKGPAWLAKLCDQKYRDGLSSRLIFGEITLNQQKTFEIYFLYTICILHY